MNQCLRGAMTALITPFKNGKLDEVAYAKLIERQIAQLMWLFRWVQQEKAQH